jgi:Spy/CpxP family protein refolding chaperone
MIRTIWIAATVSLVLAIPGLAQRGGGGGGNRGGGGGGMGGGYGMARTDKSDVIAKELKLTKEQTTDVDSIFDAAQKEVTPLVPQLRDGRVAITKADLEGTPAEGAVKALAALNAQVLKVELDAIAKVMAKLDDKQKPKSGKLFEMVDGMFQAQGGWRRSN